MGKHCSLFCLVGSTSNVRLELTDPEIKNYMLCWLNRSGTPTF